MAADISSLTVAVINLSGAVIFGSFIIFCGLLLSRWK